MTERFSYYKNKYNNIKKGWGPVQLYICNRIDNQCIAKVANLCIKPQCINSKSAKVRQNKKRKPQRRIQLAPAASTFSGLDIEGKPRHLSRFFSGRGLGFYFAPLPFIGAKLVGTLALIFLCLFLFTPSFD